MKNKIYIISQGEIIKAKKELSKEDKVYIVEFAGELIQNRRAYLDVMKKLFKYPNLNIINNDSFLIYIDFMTELSWLNKEKAFNIIIYNYSKMLINDPSGKQMIHDIFEENILPFWEEEIEHCVVGGKAKPFNVYLVD